jgi:hypothetical protein
MPRRLKKARPVDIVDYTPESRILRAEFVRMIADRVREPDEKDQQARNRVSHSLTYAIRQRKLCPPTSGAFLLSDVLTWAQTVFPGRLNDLLPLIRPIPGNLEATLPMFGASLTGLGQLPTDLAGCQQMLLEYITKVGALERELGAVRAENERLKPDAEKWRALCANNRESAKTGKRRRR